VFDRVFSSRFDRLPPAPSPPTHFHFGAGWRPCGVWPTTRGRTGLRSAGSPSTMRRHWHCAIVILECCWRTWWLLCRVPCPSTQLWTSRMICPLYFKKPGSQCKPPATFCEMRAYSRPYPAINHHPLQKANSRPALHLFNTFHFLGGVFNACFFVCGHCSEPRGMNFLFRANRRHHSHRLHGPRLPPPPPTKTPQC
jgi:hypothetical protein